MANVWDRAITLKDTTKYDSTVKELGDKYKKVFVLFTGEKDASGVSWCPDCVQTEPCLKKALSNVKDESSVLLVCSVARSEYKGNPEYPYRKHNGIRLKSVPTFGVLTKPKMFLEMSLSDHDIEKEDLLEEILHQ